MAAIDCQKQTVALYGRHQDLAPGRADKAT
jgi:hypothetical protein